MVYLAPVLFIGNMLQVMCCSVYFEIILNKKLLFAYRNNNFIAVDMSGCLVAYVPPNFF